MAGASLDSNLRAFLEQAAQGGLLPWAAEREAAARFGRDAYEIQGAALAAGLVPARYARNLGSIGLAGQRALHAARILVVGCGGLGGHLVEGLARLGCGGIVAVDPDNFDESNLNRQTLCTLDDLGQSKALAAARRVAAVNPATRVRAVPERLDEGNAAALLAGCNLAVDGLDSVRSRVLLSRACAAAGVPLVHAAVAGWFGQAATQRAGTAMVAGLYAAAQSDQGAESSLGNQFYGPAGAAAIQLAEACQLVTGGQAALVGRLFTWDLQTMTSASFDLA